MAAITQLTYDQFRQQFQNEDERARYEFWYGEAIPRSMPTLVHGLLQKIIMQLLDSAGFTSASEVELRIDPRAYPTPDVIASRNKLAPEPYPKKATDVVVEIISGNDGYVVIQEKCRSYRAWGFGHIYLVVPDDRTVLEWRNGASVPVDEFVGIPTDRIWQALSNSVASS